ncbi:MAG TPA: ABC transporter permease [Stellaceae bacterium]|jgi:lipopolysaccharide transport system permease protein|nr:ABC transporter permease [Stellaceae bacterium]
MDTIAPAAQKNGPRTPPRVIRLEGGAKIPAVVGTGPFASFVFAWRQRQLIRRLVQRDVEQRYRGSFLGKIWAVIAPLFMLSLYTIAFSVVIRPQWQTNISSPAEIALIYFSGLILFDFFFECINRAPPLMFENISYIKKMVFPLEILAWVVLGGALFRVIVGIVLLAIFYAVVRGAPPLPAIVIPLLVVLLSVMALGFVWLLSALSVFLRDIRHVIAALMPAFMFLTPVFFPLSAAPPLVRRILYVNPLTFILEGVRGALFSDTWPNWLGMLAYAVIACLFAWFGYRVFMKLRSGFADVI